MSGTNSQLCARCDHPADLHGPDDHPFETSPCLKTSEVLAALSSHLGADPDGTQALRLLSFIGVADPVAILRAVATAERLYPTT